MGIYDFKREVIKEVYFGETTGIQNIQKQLSIFRKKYIGKKFEIGINGDPELYKFNRLVEEEFGFGVFSLTVVNQSQENAFTMPIGVKLDTGMTDKNLISKKDGFKYNKDADYSCMVCIYSGMLCDPKFTDREIMAIILHEIGHNFSSAVNENIGIINNAIRILIGSILVLMICTSIINPILGVTGALIGLSLTDYFQKFKIDLDKRIRTNSKKLSYFLDFSKNIQGMVVSIQGEISFIQTVALTPTIIGSFGAIFFSNVGRVASQLLNPIMFMRKIGGYPDEQFSDNFATIYGYGPDLISGLSKGTYGSNGLASKEIFDNIPIVSQLFYLMILPIELAMGIFDEHPITPARLNNEITLLQAELKKGNIDPKMRQRIESDIKELNKVFDKYIDARNQLPSDPYIFKKLYHTWLYNSVGGDIKHMLYTSNSPEIIDKGYKKALK